MTSQEQFVSIDNHFKQEEQWPGAIGVYSSSLTNLRRT